MKTSRFSEEQIIGFLKQAEAGMQIKELCRKGGFSDATFYKWRSKYGGMEVPDARRLRELESENAKLKRLLAEAHLDMHALKSVFNVKNSPAGQACGDRADGQRLPSFRAPCLPACGAIPRQLSSSARGRADESDPEPQDR